MLMAIAMNLSRPATIAGASQGTQRSDKGCTFAGARSGARFSFVFDRPNAGISDDGRGGYTDGVDGVQSTLANAGVRVYPFTPSSSTQQRTLKIDLSKPVDMRSQSNYGVIDRSDSNFRVHWKQDDTAKVITGILEMPIGMTVKSQRVEASVMLDGRQHVLRFGNLDTGVCWTAIRTTGEGTTEASVTRTSDTEWFLDLPPGSVGRLWDLKNTATETTQLFEVPTSTAGQSNGDAIDKGRYYVDVHAVIRRIDRP